LFAIQVKNPLHEPHDGPLYLEAQVRGNALLMFLAEQPDLFEQARCLCESRFAEQCVQEFPGSDPRFGTFSNLCQIEFDERWKHPRGMDDTQLGGVKENAVFSLRFTKHTGKAVGRRVPSVQAQRGNIELIVRTQTHQLNDRALLGADENRLTSVFFTFGGGYLFLFAQLPPQERLEYRKQERLR
jgi:hypothetical protein